MEKTTTKIAEFSPVTESDVDPYGELFWAEEMSKNLSQQWTEFVEKVFYEYGEKSVYVNPATGEVIAHIDGAWRGWDEQDGEEIVARVSEFECDFDALEF